MAGAVALCCRKAIKALLVTWLLMLLCVAGCMCCVVATEGYSFVPNAATSPLATKQLLFSKPLNATHFATRKYLSFTKSMTTKTGVSLEICRSHQPHQGVLISPIKHDRYFFLLYSFIEIFVTKFSDVFEMNVIADQVLHDLIDVQCHCHFCMK